MQITQCAATKRCTDVERPAFTEYQFTGSVIAGRVCRFDTVRQAVVGVFNLFPEQAFCIIQGMNYQGASGSLKQRGVQLDDVVKPNWRAFRMMLRVCIPSKYSNCSGVIVNRTGLPSLSVIQ